MKKKIALPCAAVLLVTSSAALAQLSIGPQIVFDPAVLGKLEFEIVHLVKEYGLMVEQYAKIVEIWHRLESNAKAIPSAARSTWQFAISPLVHPSTNGYGASYGWMGALNNGLGAADAYSMATIHLSNTLPMMMKQSVSESNDFARNIASVEINDGIAVASMSVTGQARADADTQFTALQNLQRDSLADDNDSEVEVLNKINAATLIAGTAGHSQTQLLSILVDQNTVAMKQRHDALVSEINYSVAAAAAKQANTDGIWGGHAAARAKRLP